MDRPSIIAGLRRVIGMGCLLQAVRCKHCLKFVEAMTRPLA
jgi:hypothetical protein